MLFYLALAKFADFQLGLGGRVHPRLTNAQLTTAMLLYYPGSALLLAVWLKLIRRKSILDRAAWSPYLQRHFSLERVFSVVVLLTCMPIVVSVFVGVKASIPLIQPFSWDARFAELDRWVHFGHHPWQLVQDYFGTPFVTRLLDIAYYSWYPLVWCCLAWQLAGGTEPSRTRFLLTFVLSAALLGSLAAVLFSSAGPCYYDKVVAGPNPYGGLSAFLEGGRTVNQPVRATWIQAVLWENHVAGGQDALSAISAFPSMHVSWAVLLALGAWQITGPVRWFFVAYACVILIGSVYLGWHYAVDGYAAVLATIVLWVLTGRLLAVSRFNLWNSAAVPNGTT